MNKTIRITLGILSGILCIGIIATIPVQYVLNENYDSFGADLAEVMVFGHFARRLLLNKMDSTISYGYKLLYYMVELVLYCITIFVIALLSNLEIVGYFYLPVAIAFYILYPSSKEWKNRNNRKKNNNV